ncbi:MAG: hypothetical protein CL933_18890 [Deltaproteobacteria bacterium]|nr:hypothetical protein [Deltaproteobacteria bacterium]
MRNSVFRIFPERAEIGLLSIGVATQDLQDRRKEERIHHPPRLDRTQHLRGVHLVDEDRFRSPIETTDPPTAPGDGRAETGRGSRSARFTSPVRIGPG